MNLVGSSPAESNHSSYNHFMGEKPNLSIVQNIEKLFERFKMKSSCRSNAENNKGVRRENYKAIDYTRPRKNDHILAYKTLSTYAFTNFYDKWENYNLKSELDDNNFYHVWHSKYDWNDRMKSPQYVTFEKGTRCPCTNRVSYEVQCEHEICVDAAFKPHKWNNRWFNVSSYCKNTKSIDFDTLFKNGNIIDEDINSEESNSIESSFLDDKTNEKEF